MTTFAWIVAVERHDGGDAGGIDFPAPIGEWALRLAASIAARDPSARVVLSHSLPDHAGYRQALAALPASVLQTGATQQALQDALAHLHGEGTLLVYWVGHGIMARNRRLLLSADSRGLSALRAIDVDNLLAHLRGSGYPRLQLGFFDACAQPMPEPSVLNLSGADQQGTAQYFYFSASAAEVAAIDITVPGFSNTVLALLTDGARAFPPKPAPLFAELGQRFEAMRLSTSAFPLQRTNGAGDMWDDLGGPDQVALLGYARAARCTPGEFAHLRVAAGGAVIDQVLCDALRDGAMDMLLGELKHGAGMAPRVHVQLLDDAWQRLRLARALEALWPGIRLSWSEWLELGRQVATLDNLQAPAPPDSLAGLMLGLLDQAKPERGLDSCIRLLALAARRARRQDVGQAERFEERARAVPGLAERWDGVVESLPQPDGAVFLLIGLDVEPANSLLSVSGSWLYHGHERDLGWQVMPAAGTAVEQINELIQKAKENYPKVVVELLAPSLLLCSSRAAFELADSELGSTTWLEADCVLTLRWHDRMKPSNYRFMPGNWVQQARARADAAASRPDLDIGWLGEQPAGHIVGIPFPGPALETKERNKKAFYEALLRGDPWMCWPRVEPADPDAFKHRVREFVHRHGTRCAARPHDFAEALRRERSQGMDEILCSLWLFMDDPARNPYTRELMEVPQRKIT